jgi:hypothetical protein
MRWVAISLPRSAERFRNLLVQLALAGCYSRVPFREHRICCNHRFQNDCNLLPAYAGISGNLAAMQKL